MRRCGTETNNDMKKLTQMAQSCGCAAKLGAGTLRDLLKQLPAKEDKRLLVGYNTSDDAGAYQLSDDTVLLQTLDFFPPMVDDPYTFGQIAAANALSDIYAMGGKPVTAMNIVCFPQNEDLRVLADILRGGADKLKEAGAVLVGGHSIDDPVPKYGLSVTGTVHPHELRANAAARLGDVIILTKPIGTGIANLAVKGDIASPELMKAAVLSMTSLNKSACETAAHYDVHAITDVTGFSLAGHLCELAEASELTAAVSCGAVPVLPEVAGLAEMGIVPSGTYRNRDYFGSRVQEDIPENLSDIMYDPQTSGGLILTVNPEQAEALIKELSSKLDTACAIIGKMEEKTDARVQLGE